MTESVLHNARYAIRVLARTPGFTFTVVLTLALGIGANAAVFSAFDAVLLRPLPFPDGDRLIHLRQSSERSSETNIAPVRLEDWNRMNSSFEALTGYYVEDASDTSGELPERVRRAWVAPRFLDVWGIAPALGRDFTTADHRQGSPVAALISDRYWRNRFGGDPNVLEKSVRLDGQSYPIVGVLPARFLFPDPEVDLWFPVSSQFARDGKANRELRWYTGVGRLKPETTLEKARADLSLVQTQLAEQYPETDREVGIWIEPLKERLVGGLRGSLWLIFGATSVLLMIACTNIAALLLSRLTRRQHEIAIRYSLGASRGAVVGQLLMEAAVLAFAGAAMGLLVAASGSVVLKVFAPDLPRLSEVGVNARILVYTMASGVAVALLCGVVPAIRGARGGESLSRTRRTQVSSHHSIQWLLVGVQVAFSVMLLAGAGLLLRSFEELSRLDPGFDPAHVLTFRVSGNWGETTDYSRLVQRIDATLDELSALPGVESVATAWSSPGVPNRYQTQFELVEGRPETEPPLVAEWRTVSPGYFETLRIPRMEGNLCRQPPNARGHQGAREIMVNSSFAERYFPGSSIIGRHLTWESAGQTGRVTGIVGDARELGLDHDPVPTVYLCFSAPSPFPMYFLRTNGEPLTLAKAVRHKLKELEPLRSVYEIAPLEKRIESAFSENRLRTVLLVVFAVTAVSLASLGVYGTLSFVVSLRRREVGLRVALGASSFDIISQFLRKVLWIVGLACATGLLLSFAFTRLFSGMLFGVSPSDPVTLTGVVGMMLAVAVLAGLLPAWRAARIAPMEALRYE